MDRRYDAVVFDLDGTLLDTLQDLADSTNEILRRHGMPLKTDEEIRSFVGNGIRHLLDCAVPEGEQNPAFDQIHKEFTAYYCEHCMDKTEPYPGVLFLLSELKKAGISTAIVSNKGDYAVKKLNQVYFSGLVQVAVGEREGCRRKPQPDGVLQAIKEMNVPGERSAYVGDSEVDILTAKNAGLPCYLVTWGFRSRKQLLENGAQPEQLAANVRELLPLLM